eukprot:COSAG04_NODE_2294_length_4375_cov_2.525257_5_plen_85_part_00
MLPSAADLTAQPVHALLERRIVVRHRDVKVVVHAGAQDQSEPTVGSVALLHHERNHVNTDKPSVSAAACARENQACKPYSCWWA